MSHEGSYFLLLVLYLVYDKKHGISVKSFAIILFANLAYMLYGFQSQNDLTIFSGMLGVTIFGILMYCAKGKKRGK